MAASERVPRAAATANLASLEPGARVSDYVVQEFIATGGFGDVWRATHITTSATVALKLLHAELMTSDVMVARFLREAEAMRALRHPNIAQLHDTGRLPDGRPFFVMDYVAGTDLDQLVTERGSLPPELCLEIIEAACDALAYAHGHGVIHRDVKASNVMVQESADQLRVTLLDFGVAKLLGTEQAQLTASRCAVGTTSCLAPEQLQGRPVDARTDIYSLGCLLYHLLAGEVVFQGVPELAIPYSHMLDRRPVPSDIVDVSPAVDEVVARAMACDPDRRYSSAKQLAAALRAALHPPQQAMPAGAASSQPALAVYVRLQAPAQLLDEPDDDLLDDVDSALAHAWDLFHHAGYTNATETSYASLFVRPVPHEAVGEECDRIVEIAAGFLATCCDTDPIDPRLSVTVAIHRGDAVIAGDQAIRGEVTSVTEWTVTAASGTLLVSAPVHDQLAASVADNRRIQLVG